MDTLKKRIVFTLIMGSISTCVISFTLIAINLGFTKDFLRIWLKSWGIAYLVVIPAILTFGPIIQKFVGKIIND